VIIADSEEASKAEHGIGDFTAQLVIPASTIDCGALHLPIRFPVSLASVAMISFTTARV